MSSSPPQAPTGVSGFAGSGFRLEIQALRAIAVLAVLVFHIWPEALPGGYVGVDVFFVISGYLITGILFKQFSKTGRISVREFYVRRIRRLLPAAAVVLVVVAFLLPLLPRTQWDGTISGIVASALYVQNWWLAAQAVDYLAAESAPNAVMHFWSLSVEEQYYIAWPLVLMLVGMLPGAWRKEPGRVFASLVALVVAVSLAYSIWLTKTNPSLAYFSTLTRAWELGVGGLLAVTFRWRSLPLGVREIATWVGLAMIAVALVTFDETTAFPGYTAALPVIGTALVLLGGESPRWFSAYTILRQKPLQYFGDISYSLYLWHWPVIIFYAAVVGRAPSFIDGVAVFAISCALAHQSKVLVEDRFRSATVDRRGSARAFALAVGCIAVSLAAAWAAPRPWDSGASPGRTIATGESEPVPNPGAAALTDGVPVPSAPILPAPSAARDDVPAPYRDRCMSRGDGTEVKVCRYGNQESDYRVVLVGDTYAAQWQPALAELARVNDWALDVVVKTGCVLGNVRPRNTDDMPFAACEEWREKLPAQIKKLSPDLVVVAQSPSGRIMDAERGAERANLLTQGLVDAAEEIGGLADNLVFVRSTPSMGNECRTSKELEACSRPRDRATPELDPVVAAAEQVQGSHLVDLTDAICTKKACSAVVGNVTVYRGAAHLTATYSRSLAPAFARALRSVDGLEEIKVPSATSIPLPNDLPQRAVAAKRDNPDLYADGCHVNQVSTEPDFCIYGNQKSSTRIILAGDSHAAQWLPPLQEIADKNDWAVYSFTKSACAFSDAVVQVGGQEYESCSEWNRKLMEKLETLGPSLVVTSQSRGHRAFGKERGEESQQELARGLLERWGELRSLEIPVLVVADTPWMRKDVPDCLSALRVAPGACDTPADVALKSPDSILLAMQSSPDVNFISVNDQICERGVCPAIRDDLILWRDRHHLTATYARSFAPLLEPVIKKSLEN